jgi:hypothetical protein
MGFASRSLAERIVRGGLLVAWLGLPGCAHGGFDGEIYRGEGFAFRIPPPPASWVPLSQPDVALAYRDESNDATILISGRCGIEDDDVPLTALTNHLFLQFSEKTVELQEVVPFNGREAQHTILVAKLDGVPLRYDAWVLKKDGCIYDLLHFAPPASSEAGLPAFRGLVRGFATVSADAP